MTQQSADVQGQPAAGDSGTGVSPVSQHGQDGRATPDTHAADGSDAEVETGSAQLVPVTESIRYRRRAQQAERESAELKRQLDEQRQAARQLEAELATVRRRGELTRLLAGREVIDIEAALLLAEQRIAASPGEGQPTNEHVVEQLLKDKAYLVRPAAAPPAAAGASMNTPTQGRRIERTPLELLRSAAQRAAGAGRGPELEHYLRLRRRAKG
jgi:hypothetical protein